MSKDLPKRMSVNLEQNDSDMLEELQEDLDISKSKIFRKALAFLYEINTKEIDPSSLFDQLHLLNERRHLAINKEMIQAMGEELELEEEEINNKFHKTGKFYWREYKGMGIESLEGVLKHLERHNWFRAIKKDEGKFTLELRVKEICKLFKSFLRGVFDQSPYEVRLEEIRGRILVESEG